MSNRYDDNALRAQVYDYRRGELSELDEAHFEEALEQDTLGAQHARRVFEMLELASDSDADVWTPDSLSGSRADDLFARIEADLDAQPEADVSEDAAQGLGAPVVRLDERFARESRVHREPITDEPAEGGGARRWLAVVAVAAVALVAIGFAIGRGGQEPTTDPGAIVATEDGADTKTTLVVEAPEERVELAELEPQRSPSDAVRVFADGDAKWTLSGETAYELNLESGTVLVEFLPENGESLTVVSGATRVSVVGTVFYVKAPSKKTRATKKAEVGVLTGKVRIKRNEQKDEVELTDGESLDATDTLGSIEAAEIERVDELVDLEQHRAELAARASAPKDDEKVAEAPKKPRVSKSDRLRAEIRSALESRDYARQAKASEKLLRRLSPSSRESAQLRIELSRLYIRYLDDRPRATKHLRAFLREHPKDVAADHARRQLCRLLGVESIREPMCRSITP